MHAHSVDPFSLAIIDAKRSAGYSAYQIASLICNRGNAAGVAALNRLAQRHRMDLASQVMFTELVRKATLQKATSSVDPSEFPGLTPEQLAKARGYKITKVQEGLFYSATLHREFGSMDEATTAAQTDFAARFDPNAPRVNATSQKEWDWLTFSGDGLPRYKIKVDGDGPNPNLVIRVPGQGCESSVLASCDWNSLKASCLSALDAYKSEGAAQVGMASLTIGTKTVPIPAPVAHELLDWGRMFFDLTPADTLEAVDHFQVVPTSTHPLRRANKPK